MRQRAEPVGELLLDQIGVGMPTDGAAAVEAGKVAALTSLGELA